MTAAHMNSSLRLIVLESVYIPKRFLLYTMEWERTATKCQCQCEYCKCEWNECVLVYVVQHQLVDLSTQIVSVSTALTYHPQSSKLEHLSLFRLTFVSINIKFTLLPSIMLRLKKHIDTQTNRMSNGIGRCQSQFNVAHHTVEWVLLNFE